MLNREKHRFIMFQILKEIFESDIGKHLAFKWGTACYFLYDLDRFSTDLDFDLIDDSSVDGTIEQILSRYGTLKKWNKMVLSYGEHDINIKIDISRNIWKSNQYEIVNFYGTDIRVQDKATIFANKLVALTERSTNRDIYDVWFFFQNMFPISEAVIQERTGKTTREFLKTVEQKLQKLPKNYNILDGLGEVLTEKQKYFVKEKLISELMGIVSFHQNF
jgi:predicted nucleotidyltransferase component of viral defense system